MKSRISHTQNSISRPQPGAIRSVFTLVGEIALCSALVIVLQATYHAQTRVENPCTQEMDVREQMITEAERNSYNVRYVEFLGVSKRSGRDYFKRTRSVNEGDIFTRRDLETAMKRITSMKDIFPVTSDQIEVRLNRDAKEINIVIYITER